jgi:hypothetical protein
MEIIITKDEHSFVISSDKTDFEKATLEIVDAVTTFATDPQMPYFDWFDAASVCYALSRKKDEDDGILHPPERG